MAKMTVCRAVKRWWKYLGAKLNVLHDQHADPRIQLEQVIQEINEQHRTLQNNAAAVIANQKQAQGRLDRAIQEYDRANGSARQALMLVERASASGDAVQAAKYSDLAEVAATKVLTLRAQIEGLEQTALVATTQTEHAKAAVVQSAAQLKQRLDERERLLSDLDRAQLQESMNASMRQLTQAVGDDVPTFAEMQRRTAQRVALAESAGEVLAIESGMSVDARMLELEQAQQSFEARALLDQYRDEMGLSVPRAIPARSTDAGAEIVEWPREA